MSRLRRVTLAVAALTALNLGLGYVRDVGIAAQFGSSDVTDAFFAGTFLPLLVQQVALLGSLIPAFLPALAAESGRGPSARPWRLAVVVAGLVTLAGVVIVGAGWLLADPLVGALAPGFAPAKQALAADLFRLSLPMLLPLGPATVIAAVLNYHDRFLAPAAAAAGFNATVVLALGLAGQPLGIRSVALGMALGGFVQLLIPLPALYAVWKRTAAAPAESRHSTQHSAPGIRDQGSGISDPRSAISTDNPKSKIQNPKSPTPNPPLSTPGLALVGRLAVPLLATVAVAQGVAVAERFWASHLGEGALSTLSYAMKLHMLPMTVFAGALTTVLFPTLSRQAVAGAGAAGGVASGYAASLGQGLAQVIHWTAPAGVWVIICAGPLVRLVYERQRFSPADSAATAQVLALYAVGLVPHALNVLLPRAYHARQDMRTPLLATAAGTGIYLALAAAGSALAGVNGLALALSLTNAAQMLLLAWGLRRALAGEWAALLARAARAVLAAGGMGLGCWALRTAAEGAGLLAGPFAVRAATVAGLALAGALLFWILDFGFGKMLPVWQTSSRYPVFTANSKLKTQNSNLTDVGNPGND